MNTKFNVGNKVKWFDPNIEEITEENIDYMNQVWVVTNVSIGKDYVGKDDERIDFVFYTISNGEQAERAFECELVPADIEISLTTDGDVELYGNESTCDDAFDWIVRMTSANIYINDKLAN